MAQVQTLSVTPISEANNRIIVLDVSPESASDKVSAAAQYLPVGGFPGVYDGAGNSLQMPAATAGEYQPFRYEFGHVMVDVVLAGEPDFMNYSVGFRAIKPARFDGHRIANYEYVLERPRMEPIVYRYGMYLMRGQTPPEWRGIYRLKSITNVPPEAVEISEQGIVSGGGFEYLTFASSDVASAPEHAQSGIVSEMSIVDGSGNELLAEFDAASGLVKAYRIIESGEKVSAKAYGSVRLDYRYSAKRFKISYDCPDFLFDVKIDEWKNAVTTDNRDTLPDWFYKATASDNNGTQQGSSPSYVAIYRLKRNVDVIQISLPSQPGDQFDRSLSEYSRSEVERVVTDPDSGAELRLNVVRNVTLTDGLGNPWFLQFNEAP